MVSITSNIGVVTDIIREDLEKLVSPEYIPRALAFDLIDQMTKRIHVDGIAANGSEIGTYNSDYLKLRQRKYQRSSDPKIIVSLTRQLENDWSVIAVDNGYGIGFLNPLNFQKAGWVEAIKKKAIFSLTSSELDFVDKTVQELTDNVLK